MIKLLILLLLLPITTFANSIIDYYYVPVLSVEPVVKTVKSYYRGNHTTCSVREYTTAQEKDPMLILLGTTAGATIGNIISKEKALGTGIGAVAGAVMVSNSKRNTTVKRVDVCENDVIKTHEDKVIGYDVTFEIDGRMFTTRMKNDPGSQLKIKEVKRVYPMELVR